MPTIEERLIKLVDNNLDIEGRREGEALDPDSSLSDTGISSVEFVAFAKVVAADFNITISAEECGGISSVGEFVSYLKSKGA